jgi:hypothetical protein
VTRGTIPLLFLLASTPGCEVIVNLPKFPEPAPIPPCKLPTWVFLAEQNTRWLGPCTTGPGSMTADRTQICSIFDVDNDWDVDLRDIARLQNKGPYPPQSGTPCPYCPECPPCP